MKTDEVPEEFITSFVCLNLDTRTTSRLLYRSIPIRISDSPVACLLCSLPEKSICMSGPGSVNTGSLTFFVDGN